jgi:predicted O-methyltransferase YrrM
LPTLQGPFDFFFIDANKDGYPEYFRWAVKLSRPGSVIVADNMVRDGKVAQAGTGDSAVEGVRQTLALAAAEPRVTATVIQTVGCRGYDGYMLAVVS